MRCKKAREMYFKNRDGILDERGKLKLQEHLDKCDGCSEFVSEMNECLGLLEKVPQRSPSDEFEWNVKRRIMQEKVKAGRNGFQQIYQQSGWGWRFLAGAAAAVVILLMGIWFFPLDEPFFPSGEFVGKVENVSQSGEERRADFSDRNKREVIYNNPVYPVGLKMVSDEYSNGEAKLPFVRQYPFASTAEMTLDSLRRENAELRRYIKSLEKEVIYLRSVIKSNQRKIKTNQDN